MDTHKNECTATLTNILPGIRRTVRVDCSATVKHTHATRNISMVVETVDILSFNHSFIHSSDNSV